MRPNQEFINLMDPIEYWSLFCPSAPTPDMWYINGQQQNITSNYCSDGSGSFTTTNFCVFVNKSGGSSIYSYNPVPGSVGPGGGGNYNIGQLLVTLSSGNVEARAVYNYTGTYPSETLPGYKGTGTFSSSETSLIIVQSRQNSSPTISYGRINGRSLSLASQNGGNLIAGCVASNKSVLTSYSSPWTAGSGGVKEHIIYYSTLSAGDRTACEDCLKNKYGLTY